MKNRLKQALFWIILISISGAALIGIIYFSTIEIENEPLELVKIPEVKEISIILVGDIMLDRGVERMIIGNRQNIKARIN